MKMKSVGIFVPLLAILVILPSFGQVLAVPSISIETSQDVYAYGDHLNIIINVSEVTGDDAQIGRASCRERV